METNPIILTGSDVKPEANNDEVESAVAVVGQPGTALAPPPPVDTEQAGRLFGEAVGRLPGVLRVERWGEDGPGAPTFHVYLRPDDRHTEDAVYELKGRIYDHFPAAYLDVVVLEAVDAAHPNGDSGA